MNHVVVAASIRVLVLSLGFSFLDVSSFSRAQTPSADATSCRTWMAKVDPEFGDGAYLLPSPLTDAEALAAIDCLLQAEGNKSPGRFGGVTRFDVSQIVPQSTVELASLYYISYILHGEWEHASAVALWDRRGRINPKGSVKKAYRAYRRWFAKVKRRGLGTLRSEGRGPLDRSRLAWYGN